MTPPRSVVGSLATGSWLGRPWLRRALAVVLIVVFGVLAYFPRKYEAIVTVVPTDASSLGLGGALGQLGAYNSVFGQQAMLEVGLRVARSQDVRQMVIAKLGLVKREGFADALEADRWLQDKVEIRALRGGILLIDTRNADPVLARELVATFYNAVRARLGMINRSQTSYKREVLLELVGNASDRLALAQQRYDDFRRRTRYASPSSSIGAIGERIPSLQQAIKNKQIDLQTVRTFATDDNMQVRQLQAQIAALQTQLREAENLGESSGPYSVNRVVTESTQVQKLERELSIARALYDGYRRYLEGTAVEDLTSLGNLRLLEPPTVVSNRVINTIPAALAALTLLLLFAVEAYRLRPPVGAYRTPA